MHPEGSETFAVGDWLVEPQLNRISWDGQTTDLRPQVMELLVYLAAQDGRVVSADELLDELWAGKVVTGSTVYNCIAELRHALADGEDASPYIETVAKKGYRLLAPVRGVDQHLHVPRIRSAAARTNRQGHRAIIATAIVAVIGIGLLLWLNRGTIIQAPMVDGSSGADSGVVRLSLQLPDFADVGASPRAATIAISADGRQIAYIGVEGSDVHLYLKNAGEAIARKLPGTQGASTPFFSPDGAWVGFFADGELKRAPTTSGNPVVIRPIAGVPISAHWGDDDRIVFTVGYRSVLRRISSSGGEIETITAFSDDTTTHRNAHVLPGADAIVYQDGAVQTILQDFPAEMRLLIPETGEDRYLLDGVNPKFSAGQLLFQRPEPDGMSLWSVGFDLRNLELVGEPAPLITEATRTYDVSRSDTLIYTQSRPELGSKLRIVDGSTTIDVTSNEQHIHNPRFSPNGRSLVVSMGHTNQHSIWLFDLADVTSPVELTSPGSMYPAWSPQGDWIAYSKLGSGIFKMTVGTPGPPLQIVEFDGVAIPYQWTDEGVLYGLVSPLTNGDIYYQPNEGERIDIDADEAVSLAAEISADGRWIAYSRMESGRSEVFVRAFADGSRRWRISQRGGDNPKWTSDGRKLYFETFNAIWSSEMIDDSPVAFSEPKVEFTISGTSSIVSDPFDIADNGKRIALVDRLFGERPATIYIRNWHRILPDGARSYGTSEH